MSRDDPMLDILLEAARGIWRANGNGWECLQIRQGASRALLSPATKKRSPRAVEAVGNQLPENLQAGGKVNEIGRK